MAVESEVPFIFVVVSRKISYGVSLLVKDNRQDLEDGVCYIAIFFFAVASKVTKGYARTRPRAYTRKTSLTAQPVFTSMHMIDY